MSKLDLLLVLVSRAVELDKSWSNTVLRALTSDVEHDFAISKLSAILLQLAHDCTVVVKELKQLLADDMVIVRIVAVAHLVERAPGPFEVVYG